MYGGITRYPDSLAEMFRPDEVGDPLLRLWGGENVLLSAISLNIVIFSPGQLPGYPPSLGYPTVIVLLNPLAPVDLAVLTITSDLCSPLSLVNTSFGLGQDNPNALADEGGIPLMTNPNAQTEKDYTFTLVTESIPDADDDGIENWLDTCAFDPNIEDFDGRQGGFMGGGPGGSTPTPAASGRTGCARSPSKGRPASSPHPANLLPVPGRIALTLGGCQTRPPLTFRNGIASLRNKEYKSNGA